VEYTNGINLIRDVKKVKVPHTPTSPDQTEIPTTVNLDCKWKVVHYKNGVIVAIYHTPAVHLKPMKIVLSNDELSYWIPDAVPYKYKVFTRDSLTHNVLFIGNSRRFNDADETIDYDTLKLCTQEEIKDGKKTTRKRTNVCSINKQAASSSTLPE
jgi:hypothetical protein